jgi:hypothetical protein
MSTTDVPAWEGDFVRDTITYRLVQISHLIVRRCLAMPGALEEYRSWVAAQEARVAAGELAADSMTQLSGVLTRFQSTDDTDIVIFALPKPFEFFVHFEKEAFQATLAVVHDPENDSIVFCGMAKFTGDNEAALNWSRLVAATLHEEG